MTLDTQLEQKYFSAMSRLTDLLDGIPQYRLSQTKGLGDAIMTHLYYLEGLIEGYKMTQTI